ncbi:MAG: alanine--tRNA ligase [Candidatus Cloacimonadota bacterium]|nr:MAG: alanine--tRNA ligase [Candidatus Cloacimonadota bacterium]
MLTSKEIRQSFIDFFVEKQHKSIKSAPVVPHTDPTLLFTIAGMTQFKDIFLGLKDPDTPRAVNSQKCIRAGGKHNDLEEVGKDGYHHTFFEMLGNWSFADYYKEEAIVWAWELVTKVWKLPKDKLYATVYKDDDEAFEIWKNKTDIANDHIQYHGDKSNFWEMGDTGPCGPCSEIHIDMGEERCAWQDKEDHVCGVNIDCHRFIELWNLVFIQYNRDENGKLHPLKNKYIDTGAGLERICQVLQGVNSNYETDLFMPLIEKTVELSGVPYSKGKDGTPHRVIADHLRTLCFAVSDGGFPSNEGRGYVLRRILRRASRFGRLINLKEPFMFKLVDTVTDVMGHYYTELAENKKLITSVIKSEEERFNLTLDKGLIRFEEIVNRSEHGLISGNDAFVLYDTYGFPLDLTRLLAEEKNMTIDEDGFHIEMEQQRIRARNAGNFKQTESILKEMGVASSTNTGFYGYDELSKEVRILYSKNLDDNKIILILDNTPFYAESGGQVADRGMITGENGEFEVYDVQKESDVILHYAEVKNLKSTEGVFIARVDREYRKNISRNHTATHLLHAGLKSLLGDHVKQKGSLVRADCLRFDFTHFNRVTPEELRKLEETVNEEVRKCTPVVTSEMSIEEAQKSGATALFGEKYGETVRVVDVPGFSKELCGGIHLNFTGEIGLIKIISESSVASGIRRIEAVTGVFAEKKVREEEDFIEKIKNTINVPQNKVLEKIEKIMAENVELHKKLEAGKMKSAGNLLDDLIAEADTVNGIKFVAADLGEKNSGDLRKIGDTLRDKIGKGIGVLFAVNGGKASVLVTVTKDLTSDYKAGIIVNKVASYLGGKGGGRPDMAMAGGKEIKNIPTALKKVKEILAEIN